MFSPPTCEAVFLFHQEGTPFYSVLKQTWKGPRTELPGTQEARRVEPAVFRGSPGVSAGTAGLVSLTNADNRRLFHDRIRYFEPSPRGAFDTISEL